MGHNHFGSFWGPLQIVFDHFWKNASSGNLSYDIRLLNVISLECLKFKNKWLGLYNNLNGAFLVVSLFWICIEIDVQNHVKQGPSSPARVWKETFQSAEYVRSSLTKHNFIFNTDFQCPLFYELVPLVQCGRISEVHFELDAPVVLIFCFQAAMLHRVFGIMT